MACIEPGAGALAFDVIRRAAYVAAVLLALGLSRLLPADGAGLFVRLGAATLAVLVPGGLIARALGLRTIAAALAWTLAVVGAAVGVVFLVHTSFALVLWLLLGVTVVAPVVPARELEPEIPRRWLAAGAGLVLGVLLWHVAPTVLAGDSPFHLARVRKLVDLGSLSLWRMDELVHGGLHPGYAFPLWHAFLAAVSKLAGVDPALVVQHESALLLPLAVVIAYEAGYALFDSAALAGAAAAAQIALVGFAAGHGGTYPLLVRPAPTARQLLVPAVLALVFAYVRAPAVPLLASAVVASAALALVHPTYAAFLCIPLAGWLVAELLAEPRTAWRIAAALAAVGLPTAAVSLALLPIARDTVSHAPSSVELRRALGHYRDQLVVNGSSYHLAPGVFARSGAVAVAGLVLLPLAVLAWRRRWAQLVLGGSVAVLAVMLVPFLFEHLSDALSLSQSRRAAGFLPFAFAFAGGVSVLSFLLGIFVLPLALAAGVVFQTLWPGDFGFRLENGGPGEVVWFAAAAGLVALVVSPLARRLSLDREGWLPGLAAALFLLPVAVHGFTRWDPVASVDPRALTPGLVRALRDDVPPRGVVFSDPATSYRIAAAAPVLIVAAPPAHVADTTQNRPYERRRDVIAFYRSGDLAIPRRYGARWLVIARTEPHPAVGLRPVYRDARFALYRLS
ncbi:MAG: hypothetical protein ACJ76U_01600 [Gaiellaceae bacterium]